MTISHAPPAPEEPDSQEEWAKVWDEDTGLSEDVAMAAVRRTYTTRIAVAVTSR
jgi:hypothetical protein